MAWKEHPIVDLREQFVLRANAPGANVSALCREFDISRKTGHKWLRRFEQGGVTALLDESRRPRNQVVCSGEAVLRVLAAREKYRRWGPKKLHRVVQRELGDETPSVRTIHRILERANYPLVRPPKKHIGAARAALPAPQVDCAEPNALWTVDFKGWWRARNGQRCEPLTVRDAFSRYVLALRLMSTTKTEAVRAEFELLFQRFGLPVAIQVDNGTPFISVSSRAGLTLLSAWWVSLGIRVVRGRPAHPQDNGAHERMHLDMSLDLEAYPAASRATQQRACDAWRTQFNEQRPHEALAMRTPHELYRRSRRRYAGPRIARYPAHFQVRSVDRGGHVSLHKNGPFLSRALFRQRVGLEPIEADRYRVWLYDVDLGELTL
jgi:transposase InsO family protein